jgi:L-lactate dehydrogenase complex protein LldG
MVEIAMTSREKILQALCRASIPPAELPPQEGPWVEYPDLVEQFSQVLRQVGGECVVADCSREAWQYLQADSRWSSHGRRLVFALSDTPDALEAVATERPHTFEDLHLVVAPGELAVAENGAVWVTEQRVGQRAILFLTRHLVLVVPQRCLVPHMHAAYERLSFDRPGYGCFISGPSKTADIEQSLVIGAHGPRSLLVILVRNL